MWQGPIFRDRHHVGETLAAAVRRIIHPEAHPVVLALPRGGVPVAAPVAALLSAPLDILLVRKLGVPGREELAFGAIASGGHRVLNHDIVAQLRISPRTIEEITRAERQELERRERAYRGQRDPIAVKGRTVILIDDGMATGASMLVAVEALREQSPERLIVALPVAPASARELLLCYPCEVIVHATPEPFVSVGAWYADFSQTTDEEVRTLLAAFR